MSDAATKRSFVALVLVACAQTQSTPPRQPTEDAYPKAYVGAPTHPLESALAFVHRAVTSAREHMETIQLACLRDKESKLESLRTDRASLPPAEVDATARRLRSDAERCVGGD
jgi:hypothetical protein